LWLPGDQRWRRRIGEAETETEAEGGRGGQGPRHRARRRKIARLGSAGGWGPSAQPPASIRRLPRAQKRRPNGCGPWTRVRPAHGPNGLIQKTGTAIRFEKKYRILLLYS